MSNWERQVIDNLSQNKRYPADALSRREQGMVIASYTIDRGEICSIATLNKVPGRRERLTAVNGSAFSSNESFANLKACRTSLLILRRTL